MPQGGGLPKPLCSPETRFQEVLVDLKLSRVLWELLPGSPVGGTETGTLVARERILAGRELVEVALASSGVRLPPGGNSRVMQEQGLRQRRGTGLWT